MIFDEMGLKCARFGTDSVEDRKPLSGEGRSPLLPTRHFMGRPRPQGETRTDPSERPQRRETRNGLLAGCRSSGQGQ